MINGFAHVTRRTPRREDFEGLTWALYELGKARPVGARQEAEATSGGVQRLAACADGTDGIPHLLKSVDNGRGTGIAKMSRLNVYSFSADNPLRYYDPDGRKECSADQNCVPDEAQCTRTFVTDSDKGKAMNDPSRTGENNVGPIPPGKYMVRGDKLTSPRTAIRALARRARVDWVAFRAPLEPAAGTDTKGRGGFYLHGGDTRGSAGCIDVWGGLFGDERTDWLISTITIQDDDKLVPLEVYNSAVER